MVNPAWLGRSLVWSLLFSMLSCGARSQLDPGELVSATETTPVDDSPQASSAAGAAATCVSLSVPPQAVTAGDDLNIEFACGLRNNQLTLHTGFGVGGRPCDEPGEVNSFALRVVGKDAAAYSAVARCGYIRYDNGTFVGERVQVEARDGAWCDDLAIQHIQLVDRMLLTDVAFALESRTAGAPTRHISASFLTPTGWTTPVAAGKSLCAYVAHRTPGVATCRSAMPSPTCVCPCDETWADFFRAVTLSLVPR